MTNLRVENYTLPGVRLEDENPLPFFRDPAINRPVKIIEPFPPDKTAYLGWETAFRVLPYRMQDRYTREKNLISFNSIVLENEYLKATFLPEVGGRLVSLFFKPLQRELLHRNPVFQPANLAIRNAWFSGGIEWNIGQYGHTFSTCSPVFAAKIRGEQGEPGLRLYEFERCKRLFWQIDFTLPPGLPFLVAYTRLVNPNDDPVAMYWWTNMAVDEKAGLRVLAPAEKAVYGAFQKEGPAFGSAEMPMLPTLSGVDGTYSLNYPFASEFFFQCDETDIPWEAALDEKGCGLIEAATARLRYRKLFVWGTHSGGRQWQEFLAQPGQAYLEIQAGLAPTQVHGLPMPGRTTWDWTEVFGYLEADLARVHGADWPAAWGAVDAALKAQLPFWELQHLEESCRTRADQAPAELIQLGSGWGALELRRQSRRLDDAPAPAGLVFPDSTIGPEQTRWLELLENGCLAEQDPLLLPGEWMVQPEWRKLLEQSLVKPEGRTWYALLHLGVMCLEAGDLDGAEAAWQESLLLKPSAWALRNLAVLRQRQELPAQALEYYDQAWVLTQAMISPPAALAVEYLRMLAAEGEFERGIALYHSLPPDIRAGDYIQIEHGKLALAMGDMAGMEESLQHSYAVIREGQTVLTDIWFELSARQEAARSGRPLDDELRREVRGMYPPPSGLDFRISKEQ